MRKGATLISRQVLAFAARNLRAPDCFAAIAAETVKWRFRSSAANAIDEKRNRRSFGSCRSTCQQQAANLPMDNSQAPPNYVMRRSIVPAGGRNKIGINFRPR